MTKRSRQDSEPELVTASCLSTESDIASPESSSSPRPITHEKTKIVHLDLEGSEAPSPPAVMICSLPPHRQTLSFSSYEDYEIHYNKTHVNRCLECRKNFPTEHFLNLHIEENHDALIEIRRDKGERTYACFVEDCERKCSTPQKRRMHLVDKHMFPKDYDFHVVIDGIDHRSSMLRSGRHRRRSSAVQQKRNLGENAQPQSSPSPKTPASEANNTGGVDPAETHASESDDPDTVLTMNPTSVQTNSDIDDLTGAMSSLRFVPTSVRFGRGRGRGRGGFSRS